MAETLTYIQFLDELEELVSLRESGTLYIQSDSRHLITLSLDNGRIFAMYHGPKRGKKALELIRQLNGGSYRFDPMGLGGSSQDLPETREILELLRTPVLATPSTTTTAIPGVIDATPSIEPPLSTKTQEVICQELKQLLGEILGPIAGMVFNDIASETTESCSTPEHTRTLINRLAEEIDDADEAEQFKKQADSVFERLLGQ